MPVSTPHPFYTDMLHQWHRCRDVLSGADAIKSMTTDYLPQPTGMDWDEYEAYLLRASWFGGAARTHQGLVGLVFRRPPTITMPEPSRIPLEAVTQDVTGTGVDIFSFCRQAFGELLTTGRYAILVDLPVEGQTTRPQWIGYKAEQIINWGWSKAPDGTQRLDFIVLEETKMVAEPDDPYMFQQQVRWRECRLDEQGLYEVVVWREAQNEGFEIEEGPFQPTRIGQRLDFIPCVIFSTESLALALVKPPLLDICDLNLSHYRTSADYEHDLHLTSMTTPVILGHDLGGEALFLGGLRAWCLPTQGADVKMLEPSGQGLQAKRDKLEAAKGEMAMLGSRLLEPQKRAAEAAETLTLRQSGEQSVLQSYAQAAAAGLTRAWQWLVWWAGETDDLDSIDYGISLNLDYDVAKMTPQELDALVRAWQGGALTDASFHHLLKMGERLVPEEHDFQVWSDQRELSGTLNGAAMGAAPEEVDVEEEVS